MLTACFCLMYLEEETQILRAKLPHSVGINKSPSGWLKGKQPPVADLDESCEKNTWT